MGCMLQHMMRALTASKWSDLTWMRGVGDAPRASCTILVRHSLGATGTQPSMIVSTLFSFLIFFYFISFCS